MSYEGVVALLQMAVSLLLAAQQPNVPVELRNQAISVATYAITITSQFELPLSTTTPPVPTPIVVTTTIQPAPVIHESIVVGSVAPRLVGKPILTFKATSNDKTMIDTLEYSTDKEVLCPNYPGTSSGYPEKPRGTHCSAPYRNMIKQVLVECDAPIERFEFLLTPGNTHTCSLLLTESDGTDTRARFSFVAE